jgi:hypothetical protein
MLVVVLCLVGVGVGAAVANTSHAGWPQITGMLLMNKQDQLRPLDGRPGADPFDGTDPTYSCDGLHRYTDCLLGDVAPERQTGQCDSDDESCLETPTVPSGIGHNELLGGHGSDTIHAGPAGDVLWGDFKPAGQPTGQVDRLYGGAGDDFVYASHGTNFIWTGGGHDVVHAHFGRGAIHCGSAGVTVYVSHRSRKRYHLYGCRHISYFTLGY